VDLHLDNQALTPMVAHALTPQMANVVQTALLQDAAGHGLLAVQKLTILLTLLADASRVLVLSNDIFIKQ